MRVLTIILLLLVAGLVSVGWKESTAHRERLETIRARLELDRGFVPISLVEPDALDVAKKRRDEALSELRVAINNVEK